MSPDVYDRILDVALAQPRAGEVTEAWGQWLADVIALPDRAHSVAETLRRLRLADDVAEMIIALMTQHRAKLARLAAALEREPSA